MYKRQNQLFESALVVNVETVPEISTDYYSSKSCLLYTSGIGGMLALKKMGIKKDIYHCNDGHAALCNLQRLGDYIEEDGLNFNQALELVRASSLYTVHTPVSYTHLGIVIRRMCMETPSLKG